MTETGDAASIVARLTALEDIEAIKKLKAEYLWCCDRMLWEKMKDIFTEDAQFIVYGEVWAKSRDEVIDVIRRSALEIKLAIRHVHMPVIELTSSTTATGRWVLHSEHTRLDGSEVIYDDYYADEYVKCEDGRWRVKRYRCDHMDLALSVDLQAFSQ